MKKLLKTLLLITLAAITCTIFAFGGCTSTTSAVSISSIELTSTDEDTNVDTYTIYYTDGTTSKFTVTNGKDGKDGEDGEDGTDGTNGTDGYTITDIYEAYKELMGDDDITFAEFLSKFLTVSTDNSSTINSTLLSAAKVYCEYEYTYSTGPYFGHTTSSSNTGTAVTYATGSAILYSKGSEYSYFVTNYHVVYEADYGGISKTIHCYLYGSESTPTANYASNTSSYISSFTYDEYAIECEYIGGSATSDIAVLRVKTSDIDAINSDFKAVTLADGYHVGETAYTIGNAEGLGLSVTEGIVSVDSEYIYLSVDGTYRYHRSIRIDTALYEGNSGGGLFNTNGELIGLVNAGDSSDQNINYAIPLSIVSGTADNIIYYYEDGDSSTENSYTVTLGITYTTANSKYVYDSISGYGEITEDIIVSEISESSIAQSMGLEVGDYLKEMTITDTGENSTVYTISRSFNVTDLLLTLRPGYTISFTYLREGTSGTTSTYTITSSDLVARG